ncbi:MAG: DNA mismatch repair endonuclease MutL [Holosporales bacterium]|jgi:DNA mismatch repair protein MutL|nr:DNA mismatch repair endonuclease MutL [Holosporales bacterium]
MALIRRLPSSLINQIAAGEVIARPASAVKELVENALDAQSTRIEVSLEEGGKSSLLVKDNGIGMGLEDLALCIERHATSKLQDLARISTLGFRGEALAALGSVCRMTITSRLRGAAQAFRLSVEGTQVSHLEPASLKEGTCVEAQDLFFATPARLKFLKSTATEGGHCVDILKRAALAHPACAFLLSDGERTALSYPASDPKERLTEVLGMDQEDLLPIEATEGALHLSGVVGKPTAAQATSGKQFFFVNGRSVRDMCFHSALRAASQGLIAHDRYPIAVLFVTLPLEEVDVNVHPSKMEIRFRNPQRLRSFLTQSLLQALRRTEMSSFTSLQRILGASRAVSYSAKFPAQNTSFKLSEKRQPFQGPSRTVAAPPQLFEEPLQPLGQAKAQIHKRYILAETPDAIVVVDQHAAHERMVYEKTKQEFETTGVAQQILLLPTTLTFGAEILELFEEHQEDFAKLGLLYSCRMPDTLVVEALPAFLQGADPRPLLQDLAHELVEWGKGFALSEKFHDIFATLACHSSIRSGKTLSTEEMDGLLRALEKTQHGGQCNHGRPTYVKIPLSSCDKLFER